MNKKAVQLELENTHFITPHGLDSDTHYTTAYELAKLTDYALNNKKFSQIVGTKETIITINGTARQLYNTNELLGSLDGVDGVKTGFTGNAGRCLVTSCSRNGNQIITVVLGSDTKKQRTSDSIKLIEYAFKNFERVDVEEIIKENFESWKQINSKRIYINKAQDNYMQIELADIENKIIPMKIGEKKDLNVQINCIFYYEAPVEKNTKIGTLILKKEENILETVDILCKNEITKNSIFDYMNKFFYKISRGELIKY